MSYSYRSDSYCHSYVSKVNVYTHPAFIQVPTCPYPRPSSVPLYYALGNCGQPYPTPSYYPPSPYSQGSLPTCGSDPCRR